jgi:DNA-binding transcriptional MerR regulator
MSYLTTKQVAQKLGCTQRNVAYLVKGNKITPAVTLENGHFLFTAEDVAFFNSKKLNYAK